MGLDDPMRKHYVHAGVGIYTSQAKDNVPHLHAHCPPSSTLTMASESSTRVSHSLSETRSIQGNEKNVMLDIQNSKTSQGNTHDPQLTDDDIWNLDSANPRNWSFRKKWTAAGIVSRIYPMKNMFDIFSVGVSIHLCFSIS